MAEIDYAKEFTAGSKDLIWAVDNDLLLVYANKSYLDVMRHVTGKVKKLHTPVLVDEFGTDYIKRWSAYYSRALAGDNFEIDEEYFNPLNKEWNYGHITFTGIRNKAGDIVAVACHNTDITPIVRQRDHAARLMDASLDVFCTIDGTGKFVYVNRVCQTLWGYEPSELIGVVFGDFVVEEDKLLTAEMFTRTTGGVEERAFVNRFRTKNGGIAYNLWSARWDEEERLMHCVIRDARDSIERKNFLEQSEERFKALVQEGSDLIAILDAEGNYIYVSPTSTTILGIAPEVFIGHNAFDFIHPDDTAAVLQSLQRITSEKIVAVAPFRFRNHDGKWRWIETVLTNMMDNPAVKGIVANSRDVTEKIELFEQQRSNEIFNKSVLESSPDCLKILDAEGRIQYMNFNGLCLMDMDSDAAVKGTQWWLLWGESNEALVRDTVTKALTGETVEFTASCATAKGVLKWWNVVVSPVKNERGEVHQLIAISRDITAKRREEQHIKLLSSVITNTHDAVLITEAEPFDEPGPKIIYVNAAFTQMTGYTAEEVIGKTPRILQGPNSDRDALTKLSNALRKWESCEITTINYKKTGEEFWINFTVTPVADESGRYTHWIAIERDVTAQKNNEIEKSLLTQVSRCFQTEGLAQAGHEFCKVLRAFGNFELVELWRINSEQSLVCHVATDTTLPEVGTTNNVSARYALGDGLPGTVWQQQQQVFWDSNQAGNSFNQKQAAARAALEHVVGVPLTYNDRVVGVLVIGAKNNNTQLNKLSGLIRKLESFIGSEINRKTLEDDLRHLYQAIPDILCIADMNGRFLKMNPAGCALLGYSEDEIIEHSFDEFVHPEDLDISSNEVKRLKNGATTFKFENRYITKAGNVVWLSWSCNSSLQDGVIYAAAKDITEERKLKTLNEQANHMAKIGSWEVDITKGTIFWTDMVHELHETDPVGFVPDLATSIKFYREDFREMVTDCVERSLKNGTDFDFEAVIVTTKLKERWVRSIGKTEVIDGKTKRIFGSFQDISNIKEAELRLQSLANNLPGVVFQYCIHPDGTDQLKNVSQGAKMIWGFTAEEALEDNQQIWRQLEAGGDLAQHKKSIVDSIATRSLWRNKYRYVMPNNEIRTHLGYGSPTFLADGTILFNSIILDVTAETKNEELLQQATSMARIGSWELDLINQKGDTMYWSPMTKEILECDDSYNPSLTAGFEFYNAESKSRIQNAVHRLIVDGVPFDEELLLTTAKGNERWVRCIGKSERTARTCSKIYGSLQDIHASKSLELQIKEILGSISDAFYAMDANWKFTYFNREAERLLQKHTEDVIGQHFWDVFPAAVGTYLEEKYKNVIHTNKPDSFEYFYPGDQQWYEVNAYPAKGGVSVYFKNITERIESAQALQKANERFEKVTEATNDAIWDWDISNNTLYWGGGFKKIFGYDFDKTAPTLASWKQHLHPDDAERVIASLQATVSSDQNYWTEEYQYQKADGTYAYVIDRGVVIRDQKGNPTQMVGSMTDISERKRYEKELLAMYQALQAQAKELKRSNEELEQFAFITSHDLQEPLRMISSFMDQLKRKYSDRLDEKGLQYIHYATEGAKRMKQIILDLLLYSRANRPTEQIETVNLNDIVSEFSQLRRKLIADKNATIISATLPVLRTYRAPLTQIFHCLLDNGLKYSKTHIPPQLEIAVTERADVWEFAFKDNGIGIDAKFFDKIFILFQRLHSRNVLEGNGIGLSIAKRSVEFLGGDIWLESTVGEGTTFYFTIAKK